MDFLKELLRQIEAILKRLGPTEKITMISVILLLLAGIGGLIYISERPEYERLYSKLSSEDATQISAKLRDRNIPYKVADGGTTIMVPASKIDSATMELAAEGLPKEKRVDFGIFDKTDLGMTEFTEHIKFIRAKEGVLEQIISELDPIQDARVQIVIPEDEPFVRDQKPSTASVKYTPKAGMDLDERQIMGIRHLVASAVPGLDANNVQIIDNKGNLRTNPSGPEAVMASSRLALKKQVEDYLSKKAQSMLDEVLGHGKSIVRVDVEMDLKASNKRVEDVDPASRVVISEEIKTRKSENGSTSQGGIPGTASNLGGAQAGKGTAGGTTGKDEEENIKNEYVVRKTIEESTEIPGNITKLAIAVFYDSGAKEEDKDKLEGKKEELDNIVKNAIGFQNDQTRADEFRSTIIAFSAGPAPLPPPTFQNKAMVYAERYWSDALWIIIGFIFLFRVFTLKKVGTLPAVGGEVSRIAAGGAGMTGGAEKVLQRIAGGGERMDTSEADIALRDEVMDNIKKPGRASAVLKEWLNE